MKGREVKSFEEDHGNKKKSKSRISHEAHLGQQELKMWNIFEISSHYSRF